MAILVDAGLDESFVFRKSGLGAARLAAPHGDDALSQRERHLLILLDGRRTVSELSELLGADAVQRLIPSLLEKGFARRVDPQPDADWANAITQLYVDRPGGRPSAAPQPPQLSYGHPVIWSLVLFVVGTAFTGWLAHEYHRREDAAYRFDRLPALEVGTTAPSAVKGAIAGALAASMPAPVLADVTPIRRLSAAMPNPAAIGASGRAAPRTAPHAAPSERSAGTRGAARVAPSPAAAAPAAVQQPAAAAPAGTADDAAVAEAAAPPPADAPAAAPAATPASPTQVALQEPTPAVVEPVAPRPLRHDPPRIPDQAARGGLAEGHAQVRLWITPEGKVDQVDILQAQPSGVFEDEVRRVLSLWTFEAPGHPLDQVMDLTLRP